MDKETPTETGIDSSSDIEDISLLDPDTDDSAVETNDDTDSSEDSQDSDSDDISTEESKEIPTDKNLAKFAKSQGIEDLESLSERELQLLKVAHDNVKTYRKNTVAKANSSELFDAISNLAKPVEGESIDATVLKRVGLLETESMTSKFWSQNPDERIYEKQMGQVLREEEKREGRDAAWRLANNLPRLLREAKAISGAFDSSVAKNLGAIEEREKLRKEQEGAADSAHASKGISSSKEKINSDWVESTYDPKNPEHRKLLDQALADGSFY